MEIDGDAVDDPAVPGLDWDVVLGYNGPGIIGTDTLSTGLIDDSFTGTPDSTTFTQGSADFDPISGPGGWTCVVGEVKGKNDIQNAAGILFPDKIFYFMLDRLAIEGDAQIGFWLLGDDVDCHSTSSGSGAEDFVGNHQVNDLLVQIDFVGGGSVGEIKIWRWTGSGTLDTVSVNVTTGLACAVVNQEVIEAPWGVDQKNFDPADCPYPDVNGKGGCYGINTSPQGDVAGAFFEGYIDLQALLGGELCTQTFIGETRSSQSPTASRDDWVRGGFVTKPTCEIADTTVCFTGNPTNVVVEADIVMPAGIVPFSWEVISGTATIVDPLANPVTVQFAAPGSATLQLIVGNVDCADTCSAVVTVSPAPTCEITGPDPVCAGSQNQVYSSTVSPAGGSVTYDWNISGNGTISGSDSNSSVTVNAGAAGSFTLTLDVTRDGCPGQCTKTVTVNANPTCEIAGPDPVCAASEGNVYTSSVLPAGGTVTYDWNISGNGSIIGSDNDPSVTVNAGAAGSFTLTLDIEREGCPGSCSKTVTVNANPTCTINGPDPVCASSEGHVYTSSVNPAGGTVTYDWNISGNGTIIGSDNDPSVTVNAGAAGSFTLTLDIERDGCPGSCSKTVTVNANPTCIVDGPLEPCTGSDETYNVTVSPSGGDVDYSWSVIPSDCGTIVGSSTSSSVVVNWAHGGPCTLRVEIIRDDCPGQCELIVNPRTCNLEFCTVTQGYWGNEGGRKCFEGEQQSTLEILQALITPGNPLVIGQLGQRSITFGDGDEQCIIDLLPGGGIATTLPNSFGDEEIGANCQTDPAIPTNPKTGRIRNVLLSQTITLALNLRFDGGDLCDLELCKYMTTVDADAGPDGCLGSDDDTPTLGGWLTFEIPQSVLDYLGEGATVCDLLDLANAVLAGDAGLPSPEAVNQAVSGINEGFDECRFLDQCGPNPPFVQATGPIDSNRNGLDQSGAGFGEGVPVKFGLFGALPNPTRAMSMIRFALPEASNVRLTLYNIRGQEMKVLVNGAMEQGYKTVGLEMQGLPSGIYLYRLEATGMESGTQFRESQKVLLIQ